VQRLRCTARKTLAECLRRALRTVGDDGDVAAIFFLQPDRLFACELVVRRADELQTSFIDVAAIAAHLYPRLRVGDMTDADNRIQGGPPIVVGRRNVRKKSRAHSRQIASSPQGRARDSQNSRSSFPGQRNITEAMACHSTIGRMMSTAISSTDAGCFAVCPSSGPAAMETATGTAPAPGARRRPRPRTRRTSTT